MSHWKSTCKKCGNVTHVVIGRKPATSCPKCREMVEAVILHEGVNRHTRRKLKKLSGEVHNKRPVTVVTTEDGEKLEY